ncbi:hypothetical protein GCM10011581_28880 [Saccharopolyspora subtropica]|uniref:Iminophenyl-pyruvate dimer synthase domain-containing protein n=1 Tax=Saccharopolyspora thermophila TaxID=89367 RepID=A0A917JYI3_9PSEU|nr:ferritin-like protein [Saccharopolyspora subtropica]GGI90008.1 hypothetical protein GCM10011581_28880 [Saccharopolyspora subtropica]
MTTTEVRAVQPTVPVCALDPTKEIDNLDDLAKHLKVAAQVEMSTIPPYLYSAYSIRTRGYSQWAPQQGALRTLIGVAIEEMLHLCLVRNMMIAIGYGADIDFYDRAFLPEFPSRMLHRTPPLDLHLRRLSTEHVDTFIEIEKPDKLEEADVFRAQPDDLEQYTSLGAFYRKIERGFTRLQNQINWLETNVEYQYRRGFWNQFGAGHPILIKNFKDVQAALRTIIEQGEGSENHHTTAPTDPENPRPGYEEFTHYEKFLRIKKHIEGIGAGNAEEGYDFTIDDPHAVWPVIDDPRIADFAPGGPLENQSVHALMQLFNAAYCYLLCILDKLFNTPTNDLRWGKLPGTERDVLYSRRYGLERNSIAIMQGVLYPIADRLVRTPLHTESRQPGPIPHAGPSFEYYEFPSGRQTKKQHLVELCEQAVKHFPELGGDDGVQRQINLLMDLELR